MTQALEKWKIECLPTTTGIHVFAKLGKERKTWEEEQGIADRLIEVGVIVRAGKGLHGIDGGVGWIRLAFSVEEGRVREGLRRFEGGFGAGEGSQ